MIPLKNIYLKYSRKKQFRIAKDIFEKCIIPLTLFILWIVLSLFFNSEVGFSVLTYNQGNSDYVQMHTAELLAHEKVHGQFVAVENNAGIVAVRFNTYIRINSDRLIFRIKERGAHSWYYVNSYKVDQFQPSQLFTFGFPLIKNSKGKTYQFEIESTKGTPGDAVAISPIQPVFVVKYQFPRTELFHNKQILTYFLYKKLLNSFSNIIFLLYSISYLVPLLFYLLMKLSYKKYVIASYLFSVPFLLFISRAIVVDRKLPIVSNLLFIGVFVLVVFNIVPLLLTKEKKYVISRYMISFILLFCLLFNIFILPDPNVLLYVLFYLYWLILILVTRFDETVTLSAALLFLATCPFFLIFNMRLNAEKSGGLAYLLLIIGIIQIFYDNAFHPKNMIRYKSILPILRRI